MSTFCDGSGQLSGPDGTSLPGWRDFERIIAQVFPGIASENKEVFDVIVRDAGNVDYGISIKSKNLVRATAIGDLSSAGRVYMELCNSPAKIWEPLHTKGLTEETFRQRGSPKDIGDSVLETVKQWHLEAVQNHSSSYPGRVLNLPGSIFLTISYSRLQNSNLREYQLHSFKLDFPTDIEWNYISSKCLRGYDPQYPSEALFDLYALSGGQLKYYPKATSCRHCSTPFSLLIPPRVSITDKAHQYWPSEWAEAGGS